MKSNWSYSPEMPNSGQSQWFYVLCQLKIWWMTLKNNKAPLLCYFKFCASFCSHLWNQTGVIVQKRPNWIKLMIFCAVSPPDMTDDLRKQRRTSPMPHQALCIISSRMWIQTGITIWKGQIGFWPLWPWPLISDHELLHGHQFCQW